MQIAGNTTFSRLPNIHNAHGMTEFTVYDEANNHKSSFQVNIYTDIFTFMRSAFGIDKRNYAIYIIESALLIRSKSKKYILNYRKMGDDVEQFYVKTPLVTKPRNNNRVWL